MRRLVMLLIVSSWPLPALAADGPLDARVTIDYRSAPAADVIGALARGAGLSLQVEPGPMRPVTITLTNVKLSNALNAICDNALCIWGLGSGGLRVTPLPSEQSASLQSRLSFAVHDATPADVFRALAATIGVRVTIDPSLEGAQAVNVTFRNALTADVLNLLCGNVQQCEWDFDVVRGLRVTKKP